MSDPDLLIRTAGEMRISNFLLWQISYAELWVTPTLWPDFRGDDLIEGCRAFAGRERKFGGLPAATAAMAPVLADAGPSSDLVEHRAVDFARPIGDLGPVSVIEQSSNPRSRPANMLSTRVFIGLSMVAGLLLALIVDEWFAPWYPFWFLLCAVAMIVGGARAHRACSTARVPGPSGNSVIGGVLAPCCRQLAAARGRPR